jgi:superfamily II DNA/RNA helicase
MFKNLFRSNIRQLMIRNDLKILNHNLLFNSVSKYMINQVNNLNYAPIITENKIHVGHKMTRVIEKQRQKHLIKQNEDEKYTQKYNITTRKLLIACSNPTFNHYTGQPYKNFDPRHHLVSFGWLSRKSAERYFTINPISAHPSLIDPTKYRNEQGELVEFSDFKCLNPVLVDLLKLNFNITRPTYIQYFSLNETLKRETHNLLIAETGGGKTLAYILPMIEFAIRSNIYLNEIRIEREKNQPFAIVLIPTRELAYQLYDMIENLKNTNQLNSANYSEEQTKYLDHLKNLNVSVDLHQSTLKAKELISNKKVNHLDEKPVDVLITIPGQLEKRQREKYFNSVHLKQIVLDEADTLLDDSFNETTIKSLTRLELNLSMPKLQRKIKANIPSDIDEDQIGEDTSIKNDALDLKLRDPSTQLLFVTATIPRGMKTLLENLIDCDNDLKKITTNRINKLLLHVPQKFIRTNAETRLMLLIEIIKKELEKGNNSKRTVMIFSHRTKTVEFVSKYLKENKIECEMLINRLNNQDREKVVSRFFNGEIRVLCCTDIASRGWNTSHVNHVINFEMPPFIADYLHRVGRVGRLDSLKKQGNNGMITNFITKKYEIDMVMNIEKSIRLETELKSVNANIKRLYKNLHEPEQIVGLKRRLSIDNVKRIQEEEKEAGQSKQGELN